MIGAPLQPMFGMRILVYGEGVMRALIKRAGADPDEWDTTVVFIGSPPSEVAGSELSVQKMIEGATEGGEA